MFSLLLSYWTVCNFIVSEHIELACFLSLCFYRAESSIGQRALLQNSSSNSKYWGKLLDKSKSSVQDTKSTRNRTSVFTTGLNERVLESKTVYCFSVYTYRSESSIVLCSSFEPLGQIQRSNVAYRTESSVGQRFWTELDECVSRLPAVSLLLENP